MKAAGYETAQIGKWHLGSLPAFDPLKSGYDHFWGLRGGGIDIRPALSGGSLPERTLFWRYKNHGQQAARRGKWKYLKIADNTFLFDVVADPLERANLKSREPEVFKTLADAWAEWNAGMLPLDPKSYTHGFTGRTLADHYGVAE
ncbi:hypothetical protein NSE01_17680 [Novosphingobium sediminis]|uniref:Sulfatase N-terminal domain-containing protein n=2 Tax=Novosphingobium sediminis TaxID=707214 RepID=A0A512AJS1_9SPHN|nr:hypothetical protein NSE01_17680 [Novosphingobium sediminis]